MLFRTDIRQHCNALPLGLLLFFSLAVSVCAAEDGVGAGRDSEALSSLSAAPERENDPLASEAASASSEQLEEDIGPLDDWHVPADYRAARPSSAESQGASSSSFDMDASADETGGSEGNPPVLGANGHDAAPGEPRQPAPQKSTLDAAAKARIRRAKSLQAAIAREERRKFPRSTRKDPRGEAELKICSLNLNSYGLSADYRRILRKKSVVLLKSRERSALLALGRSGCDVVALQGLLGSERKNAKAALDGFAEKLAKTTSRTYQSYLSDSNNKLIRHAFLVDSDIIKVIQTRSYIDAPFPAFADSKLKQFPRGPFEIELLIQGKGAAGPKSVVLITDCLQNRVQNKPLEPVSTRMQMAEGLRRVVEERSRGFSAEDAPLLVLAVDRVCGQGGLAARLLNGALRLADFSPGGPCGVAPDGKWTCNERVQHPRVLFGVLDDNFAPPPKWIHRVVDGKAQYERDPLDRKLRRAERKADERRSAEIYLQQADLPYAAAGGRGEGRLQAGQVGVKNSLPGSPLVWVELNW